MAVKLNQDDSNSNDPQGFSKTLKDFQDIVANAGRYAQKNSDPAAFFDNPLGDWLLSRTPNSGGRGGPNTRSVGGAIDAGPTRNKKAVSHQQTSKAPLSFADYLALANSYGAGSTGPDYSALEAQLRANADSGDAKLAAMYSALQNGIAADAM